jgi:hypothetical protein
MRMLGRLHAPYARPRGRQRSRAATTRREKLSLGSDVGSCRDRHLSVDDSLMNGPRSETLQFIYHSLGLESDNAFTDDQPGSILENTKRRLKECEFAKDRIDSVRSCDRSMDQCGSATRLIRLFDTEAGSEMGGDTWVLEDGRDIRVDYKGIWHREMERRVCIESRLYKSPQLLVFLTRAHTLLDIRQTTLRRRRLPTSASTTSA